MTFSMDAPEIESDHRRGDAQRARNQEEGRRRYARTAVGRGAAGVDPLDPSVIHALQARQCLRCAALDHRTDRSAGANHEGRGEGQ